MAFVDTCINTTSLSQSIFCCLHRGAGFILLFSSFLSISLVSNLIDFRLHINFVDQMLFGGGVFIGIVAAVTLLENWLRQLTSLRVAVSSSCISDKNRIQFNLKFLVNRYCCFCRCRRRRRRCCCFLRIFRVRVCVCFVHRFSANVSIQLMQ